MGSGCWPGNCPRNHAPVHQKQHFIREAELTGFAAGAGVCPHQAGEDAQQGRGQRGDYRYCVSVIFYCGRASMQSLKGFQDGSVVLFRLLQSRSVDTAGFVLFLVQKTDIMVC